MRTIVRGEMNQKRRMIYAFESDKVCRAATAFQAVLGVLDLEDAHHLVVFV